MNKNKKWGITHTTDEDVYICMFISRKKDNKQFEDFKERRVAFVTTRNKIDEYLLNQFQAFVKSGRPGEFCRMYYSVNARKAQLVNNQLIHYLIDNPDFNPCAIEAKVASIAAKPECAATKHWMFDFDDVSWKLDEFVQDIKNIDKDLEIVTHQTPHGYAVITDRGFDTRTLLQKWHETVELKKDDLLCYTWGTNE